jgi:hypothetical protein
MSMGLRSSFFKGLRLGIFGGQLCIEHAAAMGTHFGRRLGLS